MCRCLQTLCEKYSKEYARNGLDACVSASIHGEIRVVQFVEDRGHWGTKTGKIRRSKVSKYVSMPEFRFCPICGKKTDKTFARIWYDEKGNVI